MKKQLILIALLTANCGRLDVKGGTNHESRSVIEGETTHTIKIDFDSIREVCEGQYDEAACVARIVNAITTVVDTTKPIKQEIK